MATPVKIEIREEKMDLISCIKINGEYDLKSGICRYKVKINGDGEEEYLGDDYDKKKERG